MGSDWIMDPILQLVERFSGIIYPNSGSMDMSTQALLTWRQRDNAGDGPGPPGVRGIMRSLICPKPWFVPRALVRSAATNTTANSPYNFPADTSYLKRSIQSFTAEELDVLRLDMITMSPACEPFPRSRIADRGSSRVASPESRAPSRESRVSSIADPGSAMPWSVPRGSDSSGGVLIRPAELWSVPQGPDSSCGVLIVLQCPDPSRGALTRPSRPWSCDPSRGGRKLDGIDIRLEVMPAADTNATRNSPYNFLAGTSYLKRNIHSFTAEELDVLRLDMITHGWSFLFSWWGGCPTNFGFCHTNFMACHTIIL